jgi:hypothetical protein
LPNCPSKPDLAAAVCGTHWKIQTNILLDFFYNWRIKGGRAAAILFCLLYVAKLMYSKLKVLKSFSFLFNQWPFLQPKLKKSRQIYEHGVK